MTLLEHATPQIGIVSEFCCTKGDYRFEIIKAMKEFGSDRVFPAEPGFKMSINGKNMECSLCKCEASVLNMKIMRPKEEYGTINYVCPNCLL